MKEVKRRYIYDETYNKIVKWAYGKNVVDALALLHHSPNNKSNFPFLLEQYINELEYKLRRNKKYIKNEK